MWQSLGGFRPDGLRAIETKIWEALFDMATLKVTNTREMLVKLSATVKDLLQNPVHDLQPCWFGTQGEKASLSEANRRHVTQYVTIM